MNVEIEEARNRWDELIQLVEDGKVVIITSGDQPVAQLEPPPAKKRKVILGGMKDRIKFLPGWDDPITEEELLGEND